jgi:hypothetical protein
LNSLAFLGDSAFSFSCSSASEQAVDMLKKSDEEQISLFSFSKIQLSAYSTCKTTPENYTKIGWAPPLGNTLAHQLFPLM